jgi:hypothetical protein
MVQQYPESIFPSRQDHSVKKPILGYGGGARLQAARVVLEKLDSTTFLIDASCGLDTSMVSGLVLSGYGCSFPFCESGRPWFAPPLT